MSNSADRALSIRRGLDFIWSVARTSDGFDSYGSLLICCFALIGATSANLSLKQVARTRAQTLDRRWSRLHPITTAVTPDLFRDFVMIRYALSRMGARDALRNLKIATLAKRFSAAELLGFNPLNEPPANDLPYQCECGLKNKRGRSFCRNCRRRLEIQSRYRVWMEALADTYVSERCGQIFGAHYLDVLKWLPKMRPYPLPDEGDVGVLRDAIYAVTHVVYTLNDYGTYRLSPRWLPQEFAFLKANVVSACEREDPDVLGELLDSLKAFGLNSSHPIVKRGFKYLLSSQNKDGSWGDPNEQEISTRCHTTWTAIDGLRSYRWRGERLSLPNVKSMLREWTR